MNVLQRSNQTKKHRLEGMSLYGWEACPYMDGRHVLIWMGGITKEIWRWQCIPLTPALPQCSINPAFSVAMHFPQWSINPCTPNSVSLLVYFDDSSKASVKVNPSDTTADLLDKVKDRVTSSAALLWLVDNEGHGM